jgi:hypothetical protein
MYNIVHLINICRGIYDDKIVVHVLVKIKASIYDKHNVWFLEFDLCFCLLPRQASLFNWCSYVALDFAWSKCDTVPSKRQSVCVCGETTLMDT